MEPKLSKAHQAIMDALKKDLEKRLLTPEQYELLRKGLVLQESWGILGRFVIGLAAVLGAGYAIFGLFPGGGK